MYICDFFLFHIEIEGKCWWIIGGKGGGGGAKGMLAPYDLRKVKSSVTKSLCSKSDTSLLIKKYLIKMANFVFKNIRFLKTN